MPPKTSTALIALAASLALLATAPASAYLYWTQPKLAGAPVNGDEAGITLPMPGATPKEVKAALVWTMRAGLNVAALQCQFSPGLMTVDNYNTMLKQHAAELRTAYDTVDDYFKRTAAGPAPKGKKAKSVKVPDKVWLAQAESYNTRTFNSFSTIHAQLSFCETAASIGRDALSVPPGHLVDLASARMRELRNSLTPVGDAGLYSRPGDIALQPTPDLPCVNSRGKIVKCKPEKR